VAAQQEARIGKDELTDIPAPFHLRGF
jgi:hypothetical protein